MSSVPARTLNQKAPFIKVEPPGPNARAVIARDHKFMATATKCAPIVAKRAEGVVVEDVDGNLYIDFTSGVGVVNTGHCHTKIVNAIRAQVGELMHFAGTDFYYELQTRLAERLASLMPGNFDKKSFLTNSGTESVEAAIKLARWYTRRSQFIGFIGSFHGRTMGSLAITSSKLTQRERFFPMMPGVTHIPYAYCYRCAYHMEFPECDVWCARILDELYFEKLISPEEVAALFFEPLQGEGGYIMPPAEFARELRKITEKHGILLVDDEVQAGFGRTGMFFAVEHFGIVPDVIAIAKGMGSGVPIGAAVFNAKYDFGVAGAHSNTYGGNLLACASAIATIEVIEEEGLAHNAMLRGKQLRARLLELQDKFDLIGDVRGTGLMQATELVEDRSTKTPAVKQRDEILKESYKRGLLLLPCGESTIRYVPPLVIDQEQLDVGLNVLEDSFKAIAV